MLWTASTAFGLEGQTAKDLKRLGASEVHPLPYGGVSFEGFVSDYMVEVEGLSPLKNVMPGKWASYKESWELYRKNEEK